MKNILFAFLLLLTMNSMFAFHSTDTLKLKNEFKELTIKYQYGDEHYTVEEMKFVNNGDEIIASISKPDNHLLVNSETKLTTKDIASIDKFLSKAYEFKDSCLEVMSGTYLRYYNLNIDGKEITIRKFCNWGDSNYIRLKNQIFEIYLQRLEEERKQLNSENNEILNGNWKYDFSIHNIEKGKIYTFTRIVSNSGQKCFIKFKPKQKLVDYYCLVNSKTQYNFKFDIINEDLLLFINARNKKNRKNFVYSYIFRVIQIDKNEIKLTTMN